LWNSEIKNNKSTGYYFLVQEEGVEPNNNIQLLDSFNLFNALSLTNNYSEHIQFENRIPKGTEHIYGLLHAIKNKLIIEIEYHKFYEDASEKVIVHPYLIKQFKGRWYLLCQKEEVNAIRTYALDRVITFEIKKKKFSIPKDLDLVNYFNHCFGIITPDKGKPEKVIFSFDNEQANYIKNYPLHHSQHITKSTNSKVTFEVTTFITYDLIMELLSYGEEIEIHSPKSLIHQISVIAKNILKKY